MKIILTLLMLLMVSCQAAWAQGNFSAATCSRADVNAVINGPTHVAVDGDTISIPSGTCTWATGVAVASVGITIVGSGTPNTGTGTVGAGTINTTLVANQGTVNPLFNVTGITFGQTFRMSLLNIQPLAPSTALYSPIQIIGTCTASGCPNIHLDNLNFSGWGGNGATAGWMARVDNVYGVLDHNTMDTVLLANVSHSAWLGTGQYGDNSWAQADTLGTASALYFENNSFTGNGGPEDTDASDTITDVGGARVVVRYNTYTGLAGSASYFHGTETTGRPRGGRQLEFYNNTLGCTGNCFAGGSTLRSGVGYIYNNAFTVTGAGALNWVVAVLNLRTYRGPAPSWGSCDGSGGYDQNDGTTYDSGTITSSGSSTTVTDTAKTWTTNQWQGANGSPYSLRNTTQGFGVEIASNTANTITVTSGPLNNTNSAWTWTIGDSYQILRSTICVDQPGRGPGTLLSGGTPSPTGWVGEPLDPVYEWANSVSGTAFHTGVTSNGTNMLIANRNFYQGASGIQISSSSPFNGTVNTGWGTVARRPSTCTPVVAYWATDTTTLYRCLTTSAWTASYTPYTYPHPLTQAGGTVAAPTFNPPAGTYSSPQSVTISTSTGGATICYTTDGSAPTANGAGTCINGTTYSTAVVVSLSKTLKALGSLSGSSDSSVVTSSYTIGQTAPAPTMVIAKRRMTRNDDVSK